MLLCQNKFSSIILGLVVLLFTCTLEVCRSWYVPLMTSQCRGLCCHNSDW